MSEISIATTAESIARLYRRQDEAEARAMEARQLEACFDLQISAEFETFTRLVPRSLEDTFVIAAVLGGKIIGSNIDNDGDFRDGIDRTIRNLIKGLASQLSAESFAALPYWVRDTPILATRSVDPLNEAAE